MLDEVRKMLLSSSRVCELVRECVRVCACYPAYSREFIRRAVATIKPSTSYKHEVEVYERHCTNAGRRCAIWMILVYVLYVVKNFYAVYESLSLFNYEHFERNVRKLNATHQMISTFLLTNCTHLAPEGSELGEDASELPLFHLRHPQLNPIFPIFTKLGYSGIFFIALHSYSALILANSTYLHQLLAPAQSELIMYLSAPHITCQLMRRRAREFLQDFANSYRNFLFQVQSRSYKSFHFKGNFGLSTLRGEQARDEPRREQLMMLEEEQILDQLVPIVRSKWWHKMAINLSLIYGAICTLPVFAIVALIVSFSSYRGLTSERLFLAYAQEMERQSCFLWITSNDVSECSSEVLDLGALKVRWSWYSLIEFSLAFSLPGATCCLILGHFFAFTVDAFIRLAELRALLVASLTAAQLHNLATSHSYQHRDPSGSEQLVSNIRATYTMANLRRHFRESIVIKYKVLACSRHLKPKTNQFETFYIISKGNDRWRRAAFVRQVLIERCARLHDLPTANKQQEFNIETLELVHFHFRLYADHVHSLRPNFTIVMIIIFGIDYGYVLMGVLGHHKFSSMTTFETLFLITSAWMVANFIIYTSANVHANTRKLHPLIWSLVAQLTHWKSTRARHLRALWLKQLVMLDNEGGLALTALGMRVTYGYIIKLMLWTATALVIAFKQD